MYMINDKVKSEKNISKKTNIKSLGNIPLNSNNSYIMIENTPKGNMMKYIKEVRTNFIKEAQEHQAISIISSYSGEGKSWVAYNLAISLARIDKKVLLIDANITKKTRTNEIFYIEEGKGLTDFIRDIELDNKLENLYKTEKYIQKTQIPNLYILQSGTITTNSSELIKSIRMKELIELLKQMYEYIIIDGTAYYEDIDCINLAPVVDKNIIVVEEKKPTYDDLINIKEEIEYYNGEILGFILNKTNIKQGKFYATEKNQKIGLYIENNKEKIKEEENIKDIIKPIANKIEEKELEKFDILHKEIKDDILIEDFINDIEENFNLKLESIEKTNIENANVLIDKINKTEENIQNLIRGYNFKTIENLKNHEEYLKYLVQEISTLREEVNDYKIMQETKQSSYFTQIIREIKNKNYDEQYKEIMQKLEEMNYDKQIQEINEKLEKLSKIEIKTKTENKKNNIIDLRKLFSENNNRTFSIDEPIRYEDLEKLAVEVIDLEEPENYKKNIQFK